VLLNKEADRTLSHLDLDNTSRRFISESSLESRRENTMLKYFK